MQSSAYSQQHEPKRRKLKTIIPGYKKLWQCNKNTETPKFNTYYIHWFHGAKASATWCHQYFSLPTPRFRTKNKKQSPRQKRPASPRLFLLLHARLWVFGSSECLSVPKLYYFTMVFVYMLYFWFDDGLGFNLMEIGRTPPKIIHVPFGRRTVKIRCTATAFPPVPPLECQKTKTKRNPQKPKNKKPKTKNPKPIPPPELSGFRFWRF